MISIDARMWSHARESDSGQWKVAEKVEHHWRFRSATVSVERKCAINIEMYVESVSHLVELACGIFTETLLGLTASIYILDFSLKI